MMTYLFRGYFLRYLDERNKSSHRGGKGHLNPSKVVRLKLNVFDDVESLIESYRLQCAESPTSPRFQKLREFLREFDELMGIIEEKNDGGK